jgi:hypothetical protein
VVSPSTHLKTETDPVSETFVFYSYLEFRAMDRFHKSSVSHCLLVFLPVAAVFTASVNEPQLDKSLNYWIIKRGRTLVEGAMGLLLCELMQLQNCEASVYRGEGTQVPRNWCLLL